MVVPTTVNAVAPVVAEEQRKQLLRAYDEDWEAKQITYDELKPKTLDPTPNTVIVDVREPAELLEGYIPTSHNLPLTHVLAGGFALDDAAFEEKFGWAKPRKDQEVIIYCKKGKRSSIAADSAKKAGYTNIVEYKGSWLDWATREGIKTPPTQ